MSELNLSSDETSSNQFMHGKNVSNSSSLLTKETIPTNTTTSSSSNRAAIASSSSSSSSPNSSGSTTNNFANTTSTETTKFDQLLYLPPPTCFLCHATNYNRQFDENILSSYKLRVCTVCKNDRREKFQEITTTQAKTRYLVSDNVLRQLPFVERSNPRNSHFRPMKLYLTYLVEEAALAIWESLENIDREIVKRAKRKQEKKDRGGGCKRLKKTLVRPKKRDFLDPPTRSELQSNNNKVAADNLFQLMPTGMFAKNGSVNRVGSYSSNSIRMEVGLKAHVHTFGPLTLDKETGDYTKRCSCGFESTVELM